MARILESDRRGIGPMLFPGHDILPETDGDREASHHLGPSTDGRRMRRGSAIPWPAVSDFATYA
jgi:hypothetical protein